MRPDKVMFIRHAEKPTDTARGVDRFGDQDERELTVRGWQRAGGLACLFASGCGGDRDTPLATPTTLFAAGPTHAHPSKRSKHTLAPLAALLGLTIQEDWGRGAEAEVADAILDESGVVLVAWEHAAITAIVVALTGGHVIPPDWPDHRFDMVWVLTHTPRWHLHQHPQCLLAGDNRGVFP